MSMPIATATTKSRKRTLEEIIHANILNTPRSECLSFKKSLANFSSPILHDIVKHRATLEVTYD